MAGWLCSDSQEYSNCERPYQRLAKKKKKKTALTEEKLHFKKHKKMFLSQVGFRIIVLFIHGMLVFFPFYI